MRKSFRLLRRIVRRIRRPADGSGKPSGGSAIWSMALKTVPTGPKGHPMRLASSFAYELALPFVLFLLKVGLFMRPTILLFLALLGLASCNSKTKEEKFWDWFRANESSYYSESGNREELLNELRTELQAIDENLTFEFTPIQKNHVKELTISADGIVSTFPTVSALVSKAPRIKNWKFSAFRQRTLGDDLAIDYEGLGIKIAYNDIYFRYTEDSAKLGLELNIRNYKDSENFKNATYVLLDGLIGEYDMGTRVSSIDFKKLQESKRDTLFRIVELRGIVDSYSTPRFLQVFDSK